MTATQVNPNQAMTVLAETSRYMLALNRSGDLYSELQPKGSAFVLRREFFNADGQVVFKEQPIFQSTPLFLVRVE